MFTVEVVFSLVLLAVSSVFSVDLSAVFGSNFNGGAGGFNIFRSVFFTISCSSMVVDESGSSIGS